MEEYIIPIICLAPLFMNMNKLLLKEVWFGDSSETGGKGTDTSF